MATFDIFRDILISKFAVNPAKIDLASTLPALGLDSLALVEAAFQAEDHFKIRLPEVDLEAATLGELIAKIDELRGSESLQVPR